MSFFRKIGNAFRRFMTGRYGSDKLNIAVLTVGMILSVVALLIPVASVKLILMLVCYSLMFWAIFRMLSRQTYKRYRENRKYLQMIERFKDRKHRYYDCPRCRQQVRVPRGKGKIAISCPKCKEKFFKKT